MADHGRITTASGAVLEVDDVQRVGKKLWLHKGRVVGGELAVGWQTN